MKMGMLVGAILLFGVVGCSSGKKAGPGAKTPPPSGPTTLVPGGNADEVPLVSPTPTGSPAPMAPSGDDDKVGKICMGPPGVCVKDGVKHPRWHQHNQVMGPDRRCYECWDEESNDCEEIAPAAGFIPTLDCTDPSQFGDRVKRI